MQRPITGPDRNAPTLAARQRPSPRRPAAPAVTAPALTRSPLESKVARKLARDVQSSKREIVYGLVIGVGFSVMLGVFARSYLDKPHASVRAAASRAAEAPFDRPSTGSNASTSSAAVESTAMESAERAGASALNENPSSGTTASIDTAALGAESAMAGGSPDLLSLSVPVPKPEASSAARERPRSKKPRPRVRTRPAPAESAAPREPAAAAPPRLSPAESAGLGLELPL